MTTNSIFNTGPYNTLFFNGGAEIDQENSTDNIVFNNYGLQNTSHISEYSRHESGPRKEFVLSDVPRGDGKNLQDSFYKDKIISIKGVLIKDSIANLVAQMDIMKKFLREANKTLRIVEGQNTKVYTANLTNSESMFPNREHWMTTIVYYNLKFTTWTPFGRDETRTTREDFSKTAASIEIELTNSGTIEARLKTYIQVDAASNFSKLSWKNNTNGNQIDITRNFSAGEQILIDGENQVITVDGVAVDFEGFPPKLNIGANSFTLTITSTSHTLSTSNKHFNYYL